MSGITRLHLDHTNIGTAEIKNNQGRYLNFYIHYTHETEKHTLFFTLLREEVEFLLNNPPFLPWFDDGNRCIRVEGDGIYIAPTYRALDSEARTISVTIRHRELLPILKAALEIPEGTSIEFAKEIRRSADMAVPKVEYLVDPEAEKIIQENLDKILDYVNRVRTIARNASYGQDDPVSLNIFKDGYRSLYWIIRHTTTGKMHMNGGIIWHGDDQTGSYSIHT